MTAREFKGISSIQEVECWAGNLEAEVDVLSLTLFDGANNSVLAYVNPLKNLCLTAFAFSSCLIDSGNTRNSRVMTLVPDLKEGEIRRYGCNITSFRAKEHTQMQSWSLVVQGKSK